MSNDIDVLSIKKGNIKVKKDKKVKNDRGKGEKIVTEKKIVEIKPIIDVKENPRQYLIIVEMPGLKKKNVKAGLNTTSITIKGRKKEVKLIKKETETIKECTYGVFTREVPLAETVNTKQVKAKIRNGLLTIILYKKDYTKKVKIKVQ